MSNFVAPGVHLLIDFWGARHLQDKVFIRKLLKKAADACNAKVLKIVLHSFGEKAGITGVAVLAESHISIHTWPEINYIAMDVFMCGSCDPHKAVDVLCKFFQPEKIRITQHHRGKKDGGKRLFQIKRNRSRK